MSGWWSAMALTGLALLSPWAARQAAAAPPIGVEARQPVAGDVHLKDFTFENGQRLGLLNLHYRTLGKPHRDAAGHIDNAVLLLHASGSQGSQFLREDFFTTLYGPGQPLDVSRFFLIMPDAIGHGASSRPSAGMHARFPTYSYGDMVAAQRRMLAEGLGVTHLRLVLGTSLGCGLTFLWAAAYPGSADAHMPIACIPDEIAGQNRVWRKAAIEAIRQDPAWQGGDYTQPPANGMRTAISVQMIAAGIGPRAMWRDNPTQAAADRYFQARLERDLATLDANDLLYQLEASGRYNPRPLLGRIAAPVTWINFADDAINLPGAAMVDDLARRIPNCRFVLIPATEETRGHSTHSLPRFWKEELAALMTRTEPAKADAP